MHLELVPRQTGKTVRLAEAAKKQYIQHISEGAKKPIVVVANHDHKKTMREHLYPYSDAVPVVIGIEGLNEKTGDTICEHRKFYDNFLSSGVSPQELHDDDYLTASGSLDQLHSFLSSFEEIPDIDNDI